MFLSVIVSCHNCRPYIKRVLNSLLIHNFDDFEVIIEDDNSSDNFMEIVQPYAQLMDIKYFKTEPHKVHCPGNTRRDGWKHASGDWITFMDHDDAFIEGAFQLVYDTVKNSEEKYHFLFSKPLQVDENGQNGKELDAITWLHGNFYEKQWLIDNEIDFKEDLFGNEDLWFNNLVYDTLAGQNDKFWTANVSLYKWYSVPESLSNKNPENTDCGYTEKYFADYLTANYYSHLISIKKYPLMTNFYRDSCAKVFLYSYFYYERAIYLFKDEEVLGRMLEAIKTTFANYCSELKGSKEELLESIRKDCETYNSQRDVIGNLSGKFIETHSFGEFLNIINNGNNK